MSGWWLYSYIVLWILVCGLGVVTLVFIRQLGLLYARLGGEHPMTVTREGPRVGKSVGVLHLADARDGQMVSLPSDSRPMTLVMFVSPDCGLCARAMRDAESVLASRPDVATIYVSRTDEPQEEASALASMAEHGAWVVDDQLLGMFSLDSEPYGVVLGRNGRVLAHQGINHSAHVEDILQKAERQAAAGADAVTVTQHQSMNASGEESHEAAPA